MATDQQVTLSPRGVTWRAEATYWQSKHAAILRDWKAERERLYAEVERMRPVVEAACKVRDARRSQTSVRTSCDIAVDAYREASNVEA